jgi:hypothetical protein
MFDAFLAVIDAVQGSLWSYIWEACQCPTDGVLAWYDQFNTGLQAVECVLAPYECQ